MAACKVLLDDADVDLPHPDDTAKLKCLRVGDIQYTETQTDDKPMLIVESTCMFSWPVNTVSLRSRNLFWSMEGISIGIPNFYLLLFIRVNCVGS